eukprot:TRINITY_DN3673_c0_g1_i2.p1 TRINITY_DN3673_c0_g1~~TRINITY_DN3673_c0_g1_i2.p1  ORF type:complete len:620 (+),score=192.96 TRINITY_DN3673_c0_g1_i2:214-1860(+)
MAMQQKMLDDAHSITQCDSCVLRLLLKHYRWDVQNLTQMWANDGVEALLTAAGVTLPAAATINTPPPSVCPSCFDSFPPSEMEAASCGHWFCRECWKTSLTMKIKEEAHKAGSLKCIAFKCDMPLDEGFIKCVVDAPVYKRYVEFLLKNFVSDYSYTTYCPAAGCNAIIKISEGPLDVSLSCGKCDKSFCFACLFEPHAPATCPMVAAWQLKVQSDSETAKWLSANTKDCPKCRKATEKNGGCNHIACTCGAHWCWMCGGSFTSQTVYTHKCNGFSADTTSERQSLDRYLHYVVRYDAHAKSKVQEVQIQQKMQARIDQLALHVSWIDLRYLEASLAQLFKCREILKYTYVLGYYLFDTAQKKDLFPGFRPFASRAEGERAKDRFEFHQNELEITTELLSGELETPVETILKQPNFRVATINLTAVALKKFDAMFGAIDQIKDMASGSWEVFEPTSVRMRHQKQEAQERQAPPKKQLRSSDGWTAAVSVPMQQRRRGAPQPAERRQVPVLAAAEGHDQGPGTWELELGDTEALDADLQEAIRQSLHPQ